MSKTSRQRKKMARLAASYRENLDFHMKLSNPKFGENQEGNKQAKKSRKRNRKP